MDCSIFKHLSFLLVSLSARIVYLIFACIFRHPELGSLSGSFRGNTQCDDSIPTPPSQRPSSAGRHHRPFSARLRARSCSPSSTSRPVSSFHFKTSPGESQIFPKPCTSAADVAQSKNYPDDISCAALTDWATKTNAIVTPSNRSFPPPKNNISLLQKNSQQASYGQEEGEDLECNPCHHGASINDIVITRPWGHQERAMLAENPIVELPKSPRTSISPSSRYKPRPPSSPPARMRALSRERLLSRPSSQEHPLPFACSFPASRPSSTESCSIYPIDPRQPSNSQSNRQGANATAYSGSLPSRPGSFESGITDPRIASSPGRTAGQGLKSHYYQSNQRNSVSETQARSLWFQQPSIAQDVVRPRSGAARSSEHSTDHAYVTHKGRYSPSSARRPFMDASWHSSIMIQDKTSSSTPLSHRHSFPSESSPVMPKNCEVKNTPRHRVSSLPHPMSSASGHLLHQVGEKTCFIQDLVDFIIGNTILLSTSKISVK